MAKGKPKAVVDPKVKRLLDLGFRPDDGWVDTMLADVAAMSDKEAAGWTKVLEHAADPDCRFKKGWFDAQMEAERIGWEVLPPEDGEVFADEELDSLFGIPVGSDAAQKALSNCGPRDPWLDKMESLADQVGRGQFAQTVSRWYQDATKSKVGLLNRPGTSRDALRGIIWAATRLRGPASIERLRQLAIWATENKVNVAKTTVIALAAMPSPEGVAGLRMIEQALRRPSSREWVGHLAEHVEQRLGLSPDQTVERFIPSCGFETGTEQTHRFGDAAVTLRIEGDGVVTTWTNDKGKPVKSVPASVKRDHRAALGEVLANARDVEKVLQAQRARLDRLIAMSYSWSFADFEPYYLRHPLVGLLARRLIWTLDSTPVIFDDKCNARNVKGKRINVKPESKLACWHPIHHSADEIVAWRRRLEALAITQPFKQAHREVYMLTAAEETTSTYSNRFAAHIIRQHQFRALTQARGWKYALQMRSGDNPAASKEIRHAKLRAEYWVHPIDTEDNYSAGGAYLRLSTDQVRFYRAGENQPMRLNEAPPLVFSEIMRDVDLFVGVASIANDPTWQDGGPDGRFRDYWQSHSFGELGATAQTRKAVLESILPRLKIGGRAKLADRFLTIKGKLRTYKIHLGSGNILMEPNDQYLCIVPSQSQNPGGASLFLPFEGDNVLSIILSKAFLLAEDDKITDSTITQQIRK